MPARSSRATGNCASGSSVDTAKRAAGLATVPSTIGVEKATNPFLRYREPEIVDSLVAAHKIDAGAAPVAAFAALREWKNNF